MTRKHIEGKLLKMGISLPSPVLPIAEYVPAKLVGKMLYVSGQGPAKEGAFPYIGRVGAEVSVEQGYESARFCTVNGLAAAKALIGTLDRITEVVHVRGFVNSSPDFHDQPQIINGASELLIELFGELGRHARAALGTGNLPGNIPVEIEFLFLVE